SCAPGGGYRVGPLYRPQSGEYARRPCVRSEPPGEGKRLHRHAAAGRGAASQPAARGRLALGDRVPAAKKILIVDDEAMIGKAIRLACEKEGYEVIEAETGGEALRRIDVGQAELMLIGILMAGVVAFVVLL